MSTTDISLTAMGWSLRRTTELFPWFGEASLPAGAIFQFVPQQNAIGCIHNLQFINTNRNQE
jgi:hypothetical protein